MSQSDERTVWQAAWADALRATSIGWDLGLPTCGGAVLGHYLDRRLSTGHVITMVSLLLGIVVGFYNAGRTVQREIERDRYREDQEREEGDTSCPE
jgi:predicted F0F1-ATPase subunit